MIARDQQALRREVRRARMKVLIAKVELACAVKALRASMPPNDKPSMFHVRQAE